MWEKNQEQKGGGEKRKLTEEKEREGEWRGRREVKREIIADERAGGR